MKVPEQATIAGRYRNVFVCSTADLFGNWVPREWIEVALEQMRDNPQWNFLCLTKFPQKMVEFAIPKNVWMGTTVDRQHRVKIAEIAFEKLQCDINLKTAVSTRQLLGAACNFNPR